MANLKEVKGRISSVKSTQQITKAMKMVAAAKLRRAQDRIIMMRPYAERLSRVMRNVSSSVDTNTIENPYAEERPLNNVLLVVVTSDRGLCGAFNSNIFRYTRSLIEDEYRYLNENGGLHIMTIGKRSRDHYAKRGFQVIDDHTNLFHQLSFDEVREVANKILLEFEKGIYDRVEIIYNEFKNVATQVIKREPFLPIIEDSMDDEEDAFTETDYIFEPSGEFLFREIVPKSLKIQFYKALLESNASEHGARMTAMDQATDNAEELLKQLRLTYNRTRQAAITKEILEIVGGAEALAQSS
jgi:F-type H+-transporting ATPase subunit gamma